MVRELRGILSAMCTPFTPDGSRIDEEALRDLVDGTIEAGVHGLVPCGSTGEFAALTTDERRRATAIVLEQARRRVPVVPHVGSTSTAVAVELAAHAERLGADGVMAVNPFYEPMSLDEVYGYFKTISDAVSIPIVVYNLPVATGMNLRPDFLARMAREIKNVRYVKDSTGDLSQVSELLYRYGQEVTVFNGWDTITFSGLALGSKGSVWGAVNVMPKQCADLFNLIESERLVDAHRGLQQERQGRRQPDRVPRRQAPPAYSSPLRAEDRRAKGSPHHSGGDQGGHVTARVRRQVRPVVGGRYAHPSVARCAL